MLVSSSAKKSGNVTGFTVDKNLLLNVLLLIRESCYHLRAGSSKMNFPSL